MRLAALALAAATAVAVLAGCGSDDGGGTAGGDRLQVVATTPVVADFARAVGGDAAQVSAIMKPNVDPHDYEASPADIQAISTADVVVENGVGLEAWLTDAVEAAGFSGPVVDSSEGVTIHEGEEGHEGEAGQEGEAGHEEESPHAEESEHAEGEEEHGHEAGDPHIWHDPQNAMIMARNIANALVAADPDDKSTYEANLADYVGQLTALDEEIERKIDSIPADQRKLVTNHDAFGYFIERYGMTFVGSIIPSFDTSAELSGRDIADLVAKIKSTGVKAIFSEASLPPKTAETIGRDAGVTVIGGENALYGDSLGPAGSDGTTYLGMMRHNTDTIVGALRG
jgi:ABC-type Zn uptake system ZnuABC Zn-binding protein ZnuA